MHRNSTPDADDDPAAVGPLRSPATVPDDVLPAFVQSLSDGSRRYVQYSPVRDPDQVSDTRLSVDAEAVVSVGDWR